MHLCCESISFAAREKGFFTDRAGRDGNLPVQPRADFFCVAEIWSTPKLGSMRIHRLPVIAFSLLALACVSPLAAQQPAKAAPSHSLWKIEGANTVYLLGSIHLLKESDYPLP